MLFSRPGHADKNKDGEEPCVILAGSVNEESDSENTEDGEDDVGEGMTKGEVWVSEQDFEGEHEEHGEGDQGEGVEEGEDVNVHELDEQHVGVQECVGGLCMSRRELC